MEISFEQWQSMLEAIETNRAQKEVLASQIKDIYNQLAGLQSSVSLLKQDVKTLRYLTKGA